MRPVNLIPPEERRGDAAPARAGALSYLVVAGLALLVIAVGAVVLTNKEVADKEAQVAALERTEAETRARAESLAAFTNFQQIKDARVQTVVSLAESRFDWQRVMEELARVIPAHVWLVSLSGDVAGAADEATSSTASAGVPTLNMTGCARSQRAVARMISAVGDIDGVTRVSATRSEKSETATGSDSAEPSAGTNCRTRDFIAQFDLTAVFDGVEIPEGAAPAPPPTESGSGGTPASADQGGDEIGAAQQARSEEAADVAEADRKANKAAGLASGGNG